MFMIYESSLIVLLDFESISEICSVDMVLGALLTAGVLTAGLISFKKGNSELGQKLMRARVVTQGVTVAIMVGTAIYYGDKL